MALIKCPECGKEISNRAVSCIYCGFPLSELDSSVSSQDIQTSSETSDDKQYPRERYQILKIEKAKYLNREQIKITVSKLGHSFPFNNNTKNEVRLLADDYVIIGSSLITSVEEDGDAVALSMWNTNQPYDKASYIESCSSKELFEEVKKHNIELERSKKQIENFNKTHALKQGQPHCPKCGSTSIATISRGYTILGGWLGSSDAVNVCQNCGYRFKPGKPLQEMF